MKSLKSKISLLAMCLGIFVVMLDTTIMNIALPEIQTNLNTSLAAVSWALNAYTIIFAATCIPLGKLANIYGKKAFYVGALILFALGSIFSGLSQNVIFLICGRVFQSFGAAVLFPLSMDLAISTQPNRLKRKATLFVGITQGSAAAFGPTLGGVITQFMGWRWIFLINVPIVLIALILSIYALPNHLPREESKIDWLGSGLTVIALFSLTMALVQFRYWGLSWPIYSLLATFIVATTLFVVWEHYVTVPMIDFSLFKNTNFDLASTATLFGQLLLVGFMVIVPTFLTNMFDRTAFESALLVTPATVMIFVLSPMAGVLVRHLNPKKLLALGFLLISLGYIGLATLTTSLNYTLYIGYCILIGAGYGTIVGPISVLSTVGFEGIHLTASQSVIGVLRQLGTVLAVALFVSGLNLNIANAKKNSLNFARAQVEQANISKTEQANIINKVKSNLDHHQTKEAHQNINNTLLSRKDALVNQNYQRYLAAKGLRSKELPLRMQKEIKHNIALKVNHSLVKLSNALDKIQRHIKKECVQSFTKLYLYAAPIALLIALIFFFVPVKPISLRRPDSEKQ
ncbi:MFS transporter [Lactiplantibacillus plantarum]